MIQRSETPWCSIFTLLPGGKAEELTAKGDIVLGLTP